MCGFACGSDFDVAAAFLTGTCQKTIADQTDIQTLFVEFIRCFLGFRKHSPGPFDIFIYISLFRHISDQAKLTLTHKIFNLSDQIVSIHKHSINGTCIQSNAKFLSVLLFLFVHVIVCKINELFKGNGSVGRGDADTDGKIKLNTTLLINRLELFVDPVLEFQTFFQSRRFKEN